MNRIYKVIWSKVKHQYVVVSELAHSCTKSTSSCVGRSTAAVLAALVLTMGVGSVQAEEIGGVKLENNSVTATTVNSYSTVTQGATVTNHLQSQTAEIKDLTIRSESGMETTATLDSSGNFDTVGKIAGASGEFGGFTFEDGVMKTADGSELSIEDIKGAAEALEGVGQNAADIAANKEAISDLQATDSRQDGQISDLQATDSRQDGQISDLQATDSRQDGQISDLQATDSRQDGQISDLQATDSRQDGQISDLQATDSRQDGQISDLQATDSRQDGQISDLQATDSRQDGQISDLQATDSRQDGQISDLQATDQKHDIQIGDLQATDRRHDYQISANSAAIAQNRQDINNLNHRVDNLDSRIDKVGAGAAALAALHPLDFDPDAKWDFAAGYGNYNGENAVAVGTFYRPNEDTMFSVGGTFGNGENMINAGVSLKIGAGSSHVTTSRVAMAKEIKSMRDIVAKQDAQIQKLTAMVNALVGVQTETDTSTMFPDVPENHWAYEAVEAMAKSGLVKGYPDGEFKGDRNMTRYEFAQIVYNAIQAGAEVDARLVEEFKPELEYFHIATVAKDKDGNPTIERVRAN